jgi:hypothetical protein
LPVFNCPPRGVARTEDVGGLNDLARHIQENESQDEFVEWRRAIGRVMGELCCEILNPTFDEYPSLKPDGMD